MVGHQNWYRMHRNYDNWVDVGCRDSLVGFGVVDWVDLVVVGLFLLDRNFVLTLKSKAYLSLSFLMIEDGSVEEAILLN